MKNKKLLFTFLIELLFAVILISLLFYARDKTRNYLIEVQEFTPELSQLQENLGKESLTSYNKEEVQNRLDTVEKTLDKAILLNQVIIPIVLLVLSLIFYSLLWKISSGISIKNFFVYSILPLLLFFFSIVQFLNYLAFVYLDLGSNNIILLVVSVVLLLISYYFLLVLLSRNSKFKQSIVFAVKNFRRFIFFYILVLLTNALFLFLILVIFVLSFAEYSIVVPSVLLVILLILINFQRLYFVKKVSKM
ncbi:MAG TPA: hypothetical protein VJG30_03985 [Candidatus Nanoarchaeia archaeon]|nr:hypothetical protein [Candidatus Nanoarchaeia archaeon]